jgi:hypothetical protein
MHRPKSVFLMVASTPLLSFELNVRTASGVPLLGGAQPGGNYLAAASLSGASSWHSLGTYARAVAFADHLQFVEAKSCANSSRPLC